MSTQPEPATAVPKGAGLPSSGARDTEQEPRTGDDLIDAAASGLALADREKQDLLDYYLTNEGLPGDDEERDVEFTVGEGRMASKNVWKVRTIEWDEWKDAVERTTDEKTGERDTYATASYIVARALRTPTLGPIVKRLQSEQGDKAPADAAAFLQRMFAKQSGVLFALSAEVLRLSKLQDDNGSVRTLDREVEAGKL